MEVEIKINRKTVEVVLLLILILIIAYFNLTATLKSIVFGDEGFHGSIIRFISKKLELPHYLSETFGDNLSYSSYTYISVLHFLFSFFYLFGETAIKILIAVLPILVAFSLYVLLSKIINEKVGLLSAILFLTFQSVVIYSTTLYVDMLFTLFFSNSFLFLLLFIKKRSEKYFLVSSILAALSLLTKPLLPYLLYFSVFIILFLKFFKQPKILLKYLLIFSLPAIILFGSLIFRNVKLFNSPCIGFGVETLDSIINSVFKENKCVISNYTPKYEFAGRTEKVGTEQDVLSFGILNYLRFAYWGNNILDFLLFFLFFGFLVLVLEKRYEIIILFLPLFLTIFIQSIQGKVLTTGILYRAEDFARYTLQYSPFVALIISLSISKFFEFLEKLIKKENLVFSIFIGFSIILFLVLLEYSFKPKLEIMKSLKTYSPLFFEACNWVKNNLPKNSTLLSLWGYRVAYNCERKVGGPQDLRLSDNATFIYELAKAAKVDYFFIEKFSIDPLNRKYAEMYDLNWVKLINENFKKVYENGVPIENCISQLEELARRGFGYSICDGVVIYKTELKNI